MGRRIAGMLIAAPVLILLGVAGFFGLIVVWHQTATKAVKMAPPTPPFPDPPPELQALIRQKDREIGAAGSYEEYQAIEKKYKERRDREFPEYNRQVKEWQERYGEWEAYKDTILNPPKSQW